MKHLFNLMTCIAFSVVLTAQPGTLDNSFGDNGKVYSNGQYLGASAMALQGDGKIIMAGEGTYEGVDGFFLIRFETNGDIDQSFGDSGRVVTNLPGTEEEVYSVALQSDGKIVAAGVVKNVDFAIVRYMPNGKVDSSFGINGIVITDIRRYDYLTAMAILPDDKIVVTGTTQADENDTETSFTIRYKSDGSKDESFGDQGTVLTLYTTPIEINSIAIQKDGKILLGGAYLFTSPVGKLLVVRYMQDGNLDTQFGNNGKATAIIGDGYTYTPVYFITVQQDGKIIEAGESAIGTGKTSMIIARFENNGAVDVSFGEGDGIVIQSFGSLNAGAKKVLIQPDNKVIAIGRYSDNISFTYFALARYESNGIIDTTFGINGLVTTDMGGASAYCADAALQPDGKIIVAGDIFIYHPPTSTSFALARYNGGKLNNLPEFAKIQKWQSHYGFTWNSWPGNKTTYYSVGRSTNASSFTEIAQVTDIPKQKKYKFEDPNPLSGIVYYRLTAMRTDGVMVNSNIITCGNDAGFVQLYPNPAKNSLRVEGLSATEKTKLSILDFSGYAKLVTTATGNSYNFNIAQLKPGNYMLLIETKGNVVTKKFVKEQ